MIDVEDVLFSLVRSTQEYHVEGWHDQPQQGVHKYKNRVEGEDSQHEIDLRKGQNESNAHEVPVKDIQPYFCS